MKKLLKWLLVIIPVVLIAGVLLFFLNLNKIIKAGVETGGSRILKVPVTLEKVSLSPFSGNGELNGLIIGNPEGFKSVSSFELGTVKLDIDLPSLKSDTIIINEVTIDAPKITYERTLKTSNIKTILDHVKALAGDDRGDTKEPEETPEKPASDKPAKKIIIKKIALTNTSALVTTSLISTKGATVTVPDIILTDIGTEKNGATSAEAVQEILTQVLNSVIKAYKDGDALDAIKVNGKSLEEAADALKNSGKSLEEATETVKGLKGLLKKD